MLTLRGVQEHASILQFIKESDLSLASLGYTDHGLRHVNLVSERAQGLASEIGRGEREAELAAMAGFCHDMGNFMGRTQHHYWGALLFHQTFRDQMEPEELAMVVQAIANHDKEEMKFTHAVGALLVLADKSDVHRSRVRVQSAEEIITDVHDRVNYATLDSDLKVHHDTKRITLTLQIDTDFAPVLEYFEIFTERMSYCRRAATHLGYQFGLLINGFTLV